MHGICLKLFVSEAQRYSSELMYEWLLEEAKKMGIQGGTAFRATAGFGRHGKLHEETFFELAGELPVEIEFMLSEHQLEQIMHLLRTNGLKLFYVKMPAEYGVTS